MPHGALPHRRIPDTTVGSTWGDAGPTTPSVGTTRAPSSVLGRDAREQGPAWPPALGQAVSLYLPDTDEPEREHHCTVIELAGDHPVLEPGRSLDTLEAAKGTAIKLLFPGERYSWGYDAALVAIERLPSRCWRMDLTHGPVAVERRDDDRVATREIVIVRSKSAVVPAHMLDRSERGMRVATGRAARIERGQRVSVEIGADDVVHDAEVVWKRPNSSGVEYGLHW